MFVLPMALDPQLCAVPTLERYPILSPFMRMTSPPLRATLGSAVRVTRRRWRGVHFSLSMADL